MDLRLAADKSIYLHCNVEMWLLERHVLPRKISESSSLCNIFTSAPKDLPKESFLDQHIIGIDSLMSIFVKIMAMSSTNKKSLYLTDEITAACSTSAAELTHLYIVVSQDSVLHCCCMM